MNRAQGTATTVSFEGQSAEAAAPRALLEAQRAAFLDDMTPAAGVRDDRLRRLLGMMRANEEKIITAIDADFGGRSAQQTLLAEVMMVAGAIRHARRNLARWMRPITLPTALRYRFGSNTLFRQPLGVVGIVSPWNYPCNLSLVPAIGAIAAGNRVMLKPSELTPRFSELLAQMIAEAFKVDELSVVLGGADVGRAFVELPFDHLVFTGSTEVGRKVAEAAARNLVPVTLELGGKSPVIVDGSADIGVVAAKVMNAKLFNAGQTCIAPDYVVLPRGEEDAFVAASRRAVARFYPKGIDSPDYTSIINERHYQRLQALLDDARAKGATIVDLVGGERGSDPGRKRMAPAIVLGTTAAMRIMQEEVFGPVLPVVSCATRAEAIQYVNARPRPLALYWFGSDGKARDDVLRNTISGGVTINDCIWHFAQEDAPFGGVGASGTGAYHGEYGFRTFSKEKPVFYQSRVSGVGLFNPPYGARFDWLMRLTKRF